MGATEVQVEGDNPTILHDALKPGAEIVVEFSIVIQSPENRPSKHDIPMSELTQTIYFPNSSLVAFRWTPMLAFPFNERNDATPSRHHRLEVLDDERHD